jgi:8-oxo-dGTP pyrophosphatase MutT (NUDIX family)
MNDTLLPPATAQDLSRARAVRPRDAASLILLRGEGENLEVLVGRRSLSARFMPGVYVFPGGVIDPPDRIAWSVESGTERLPPRLASAARAAIRETWEEVGVLIATPANRVPGKAPPKPAPGREQGAPIERAYQESGLTAPIDRLLYVGRAITPSHSFRRFNTRFFLGDDGLVIGEPTASSELEDAGWRRIEQNLLDGFRDVTRFMLARAVALRRGAAAGAPPLFYWAKNAQRISICRESEAAGV